MISAIAPPRLNVSVRWMVAGDMLEVLAIERESFPEPWTEKDFRSVQRNHMVVSRVACCGNQILGYVLYVRDTDALEVLNIAVHQEYRLRGIGRQLIETVWGRLLPCQRNGLVAFVSERNLDGQRFMRQCGFRATHVCRNQYEDGHDAYYFRRMPKWTQRV